MTLISKEKILEIDATLEGRPRKDPYTKEWYEGRINPVLALIAWEIRENLAHVGVRMKIEHKFSIELPASSALRLKVKEDLAPFLEVIGSIILSEGKPNPEMHGKEWDWKVVEITHLHTRLSL
jgi:hypothetical protein